MIVHDYIPILVCLCIWKGGCDNIVFLVLRIALDIKIVYWMGQQYNEIIVILKKLKKYKEMHPSDMQQSVITSIHKINQIRIQQSESPQKSPSHPTHSRPQSHSHSKSQSKSQSKQRRGQVQKQEQKNEEIQNRHKKYDYLNKYSQHAILGKKYEQEQQMQARKPIWDRFRDADNRESRESRESREEKENNRKSVGASFGKKAVTVSFSLPKNEQILRTRKHQPSRSYSKQSNQSNRYSKNSPAHHQYLKAYQQNMPSHDPLLFQPLPARKPLITFPLESSSSVQLEALLSKIPPPNTLLLSELQHQNQIYRNQINQYRTLIAKLQIDLTNSREQLLIAEQSFMNQKLCYEGMIKQLRDQVIKMRGYRDRYEILDEEMRRMEEWGCIREGENRNSMNWQAQKREVQNRDVQNNRELSKGKIKKVQKRSNSLQAQQLQKSIFQRIQLLLQNPDPIPKSPTLHLSAYSQQLLQRIAKLVSQIKKYEDFINSIKQMHRKIEKNTENSCQNRNNRNKDVKDPTIRQLWKWLKMLGSNYSFIREIKPILGRKVGFTDLETQEKDIKQIMETMIIQY